MRKIILCLAAVALLAPALASCRLRSGAKSPVAEANTLFRVGDYSAAITAYKRILSRAGDDSLARFNLAVALEAAGDFKAAEDQYRILLEAEPEYVFAAINLASLRAEAGDGEEAEYLLTRAAGAKDGIYAKWALVRLYLEEGRTDTAETVVNAAYAADSKSPTANYFLGRILEEKEEFEGAAAAYETALRVDDTDPEMLLRIARAYIIIGKDKFALYALTRATIYKQDSYYPHFALGFLRYLGGDHEGALAALWRARDITTEAPPGHRRLISACLHDAQLAELWVLADGPGGDVYRERIAALEKAGKVEGVFADADEGRAELLDVLVRAIDRMNK